LHLKHKVILRMTLILLLWGIFNLTNKAPAYFSITDLQIVPKIKRSL